MKVLVLDRSGGLIKRITSLISETNEGLTFYSAESCAAATHLLKQCYPDAVLLDLNLPGNKAIKLLEDIKQSNKKTVVIVWHTHADEKSLRVCKELGVDYLLDKYDEFEKIPELISTIRFNSSLDT